MTTQTLEKFRASLAEALGEDPEAIKKEEPKWAQLMKEGVLVSLHIGRWRARTRLTWGDLGIQLSQDEDSKLEELLALGHKKLLPASIMKQLDSIESGARKWLEKKSFRTYWGLFVPVSAYQEWKEKHQKFVADYFGKRDGIIRDYDALVQEVLVGYEIAARQAWSRLKALHPEALKGFKSEEAFVGNFLDQIQPHLAGREEIEKSFYFTVELKYVPLPSLLAEDQAQKEKIQLGLEEERSRVWAEEEKARIEVREARTSSEMREKMLEDMNRDIVEAARKEKEEKIDGFLKDVVSQLRGLVYNATTDVLTAIRKKDGLGPRSVVQLQNMISQVKSLNFYGDEEIDRMISQVELQLNQSQDNRDINQIDKNLADIATITRASLIGLGEQPRRARELGISDNPTVEMVRAARRGLGLESVEVEAIEMSRQGRLLEASL